MGHITRATLVQAILAAAGRDPRILGVLDYGSTSERRGDEWSDVDLALFLRDQDVAAFTRDWQAWAGQFGRLLLAYTSGLGKPWAVYAARPLPLRADFNFWPISTARQILHWPNAPATIESMLLYDTAEGQLRPYVAQIVGQSLRPPDLEQTFQQVCGDFWYYALRTWAKLLRGQLWAARHEYDSIMLGNLMALLRIEAGATEHWRGSSAALGIEQAIPAARLAQVDRCIAGPSANDLRQSFAQSAQLAQAVCGRIAEQHGWTWPQALAEQMVAITAPTARVTGKRR